MTLRAVLFDADGVLLDSLSSHLAICEDKAREYALALAIPDAAGLRRLVREGAVISPMLDFFRAVGFPAELAEAAERDYRATFMERYAPRAFPGVPAMLDELRAMNLRVGIVTSNVRANVVAALGEAASHFDPRCVFASDDVVEFSKPRALRLALGVLEVFPAEALYVGDQLADFRAATSAGVHFLGATYGWGISETDHEFPIVNAPSAIPAAVRAHSGQ